MFAEESCNIYSKNDQWWEAGKSFYGGGTRRAPGETRGQIPEGDRYPDGQDRLGDPGRSAAGFWEAA